MPQLFVLSRLVAIFRYMKQPDRHYVIEWTADSEREKNARAVAKCAAEGYIRNFEIDHVDHRGKVTPIEINATVMNKGGMPRILTLCRDITKRKQTEKALAESEERLRSIFDNAADGLLIVDLERKKFCGFNPTTCQMLGYTAEEIGALGITDIHFEKDLPYVMDQLEKQAGRKVTIARDIPVKRKDGSLFYADISAVPMTLGGRECLVGFFRDSTDRKQAQEKLGLYAAELERANEEVRQFAYIVSHDLRAPLVNVKGFAAEIRSSVSALDSSLAALPPHLSEEKRNAAMAGAKTDILHALDFIDSSATRMDSLVSALLKLSRLGRQELHYEHLDVAEIVQTSLKGLAHLIAERHVNVTTGSLPDVFADRTAMEQIIGNILTNAVLYLDPARPGKIEIGGRRGLEETALFVRDNGRGIARQDMPKVFAPFRRAGKQDVKGEGMGLAYVQALVRRHGGRIWCESEPDAGTTFTFTFPNSVEQGGRDADAATT